MIKVKYYYDDDFSIRGFCLKGHADYAEIGYDINITPEELTEKLNEFYNQGNDDINVLEAALQFLPQNIKFDDILSMWNEYRIMNLDFE